MNRGFVRKIYIISVTVVFWGLLLWGSRNKEYKIFPKVIFDQSTGISSTENIALLKGEYQVTLHYHAGDDVDIYIFRDNSGESFPATLSGSGNEYDFSLYLEEFSDSVHIAYEGNTDAAEILGIDVASVKIIDHDWLAFAILLLVFASYLYYRLISSDFRISELAVYACVALSAILLGNMAVSDKAHAVLPSLFRELHISMRTSVILAYLLLGTLAAISAYIASDVLLGKRGHVWATVAYMFVYVFMAILLHEDMSMIVLVILFPQLIALIGMITKRNAGSYSSAVLYIVKWIKESAGQMVKDIDTLFMGMIGLIEEDRKVRWGAFFILCVLFLFSRLYRLDVMIDAVNADEIGTGYDALCIKDYGVDRWTTRMPVYFRNYSSGQNALYTYLAAIVFCFTDFSLFALRLPAVFCAFIGFVSAYFLAERLFDKHIYTFVTLIFIIIWPVFFMSERWALESYLLHSLLLWAMTLLCIAIDSGKSRWYLAAGIAFGVSLYTYAITYIFEPLFLLFSVIYLVWLKKVNIKNILSCAVPFFLLGLPLALEQMVNARIIAPFSTCISDFVPMRRFRGEEFTFEHIFENIRIWYRLLTADDRPYNGSARFGTMYYITLPFIAIGIILCVRAMIISFKKKKYDYRTLLIVLFVISFIESLTVKKLNINRSNEIYVCFLLLAVYGVEFVCTKRHGIKYILIPIYSVLFMSFLTYYFGGAHMKDIWGSEAHALLWQPVEVGEAARDITAKYGDTKKLHIYDRTDDTVDSQVLLLAAYEGVSPYEFYADNSNNSIYSYGKPGELDASGNTVYLLNKDYIDIIQSLSDMGFYIDDTTYEGYSVAIKNAGVS